MTHLTDIPQALYQANLDLIMRTSNLLRESSAGWWEQSTRAMGESFAKSRNNAAPGGTPGDTAAEFMQRQLVQCVNDSQTLLDSAMKQQAAWLGNLQGLFTDWQKETARAWASVNLDAPWHWAEGFPQTVTQAQTRVDAQAAKPSAKKAGTPVK